MEKKNSELLEQGIDEFSGVRNKMCYYVTVKISIARIDFYYNYNTDELGWSELYVTGLEC